MDRNYFLLWQGQVVSQLGSQVFVIALMFWVMGATDSASLMGLLMSLFSLPAVVLGPFGGTFADRHSRKSIIVLSDLVNGLLVSAVGLTMLLRPDALRLHLALVGTGAVVSGVAQAFFRPAMNASIADVVPRERLATAIALFQGALVVALIAGQALGGVLYGALGAPLLFLANGLTFLFSALTETWMQLPPVQRRAGEPGESGGAPRGTTTPAEALRGYARETWEGVRYVWGRVGLRNAMLTFGVASFFGGPVVVLFPYYVRTSLGRGAEWFGFLMAAGGAGAVLGFTLAARLRPSRRAAGAVVLSAMLCGCALLALLGQLTAAAPALGVVFALGALLAMAQTFVRAAVQATTPSAVRGRTLALIALLSGGLSPLGMAFGGVLGDLTGKNVPFVYGLSGVASALTVLVAAARREFWELLASGPTTATAGRVSLEGAGSPGEPTGPRSTCATDPRSARVDAKGPSRSGDGSENR